MKSISITATRQKQNPMKSISLRILVFSISFSTPFFSNEMVFPTSLPHLCVFLYMRDGSVGHEARQTAGPDLFLYV